MQLSVQRIEIGLGAAVVAFGVLIALTTLGRGLWLDEFWTMMSTARGMSPAAFGAIMAGEVHPILHYGLAYLAQAVGVTDPVALRALNFSGLALAGWAGWFALRNGVATPRQLVVLAALYASSAMFLDYAAEMRAYFLLFSASVAAGLVWLVLARRLESGERLGAGLLTAWFAVLAVFVNLHYFATVLGGLMTIALLALALEGRGLLRWPLPAPLRLGALPVGLALVSLAAAAPAALLFIVQALNTDPDLIGWVATGRIDAAFEVVDALWAAVAVNVVAVGCALAAALGRLGRWDEARAIRHEAVLAVVVAAFFALLLVLNLVQPIIIDRYLIAAGGVVAVVVGQLAGGAFTPRWTAVAVCVFALLAQARGLYSGTYQDGGWRESARFVATRVAACPASTVHLAPETDLGNRFAAVRRFGQAYYADRLGFAVTETALDETITADGACPAIVWVEHITDRPRATAEEVLDGLGLTASGAVALRTVGSAVVIEVR